MLPRFGLRLLPLGWKDMLAMWRDMWFLQLLSSIQTSSGGREAMNQITLDSFLNTGCPHRKVLAIVEAQQ